MNAQQFRKLIKEEISNVLSEAPGNRYPSTTVTAIDAKKMTAIAKIITDTELFPELDGESVCPKSMSEVKDTIDVIVKLPKALAGDYDSFGKFLDKMTDKYGADQVIWMNAENADQIEDSKLNSVFSELEEALSDLDTCFAEFESMNDFAKAYNRLAKAVDKVLAAMSKNKPAAGAPSASKSKPTIGLTKKSANSKLDKAKKNIVGWAKSQGLSSSQLGWLDLYIADIVNALEK
jgi:hypothetical protein